MPVGSVTRLRRVSRPAAATDLDACPVTRNDSALPVDAQTHVGSEIAWLRDSIGRAAAAVERTLNDHPSARDDDYPRWGGVEHSELCRQLNALHDHVARAQSVSQDQLHLRAEFATLVCFAKTLQTDAEAWRAALRAELEQLEQEEAAVRADRERLAAARECLMRRRDALQFTVDETAGRIARETGGDCRSTLPVFRLGEGLAVCSVAVLSPRRWFRFQHYWLVTLSDSRDQMRVRRSY